jgi:DNA invertase Pin-like site-specific DNA recombinase
MSEFVPKRVLGYCRVSGKDTDAPQYESGMARKERLERHIEYLQRWCQKNDYPEPIIYSEVESGQVPSALDTFDKSMRERGAHRGEQARLLQEMRPGDLIIVKELSRWCRDAAFTLESFKYFRLKDIRFAVTDDASINTETNFMVLLIRAGLGEEEFKTSRLTKGRRDLRDVGIYADGLPPFGYTRATRIGLRLPDRDLHPDEYAPLLPKLFNLCASGKSLQECTDWLRKQGCVHTRGGKRHGQPRLFEKSHVNDILRNRVYLGEIKNSKGVWIQTPHVPPLVSAEQFVNVADTLTSRRFGKKESDSHVSRTANWLLRGLANCKHCGARIGSAYGESDKDYYMCNGHRKRAKNYCAKAKYVPVPSADSLVNQLLLERLLNLRTILANYSPEKSATAPDFANLREKLRERKERIGTRFELGDLSETEYRSKAKTIVEEITKLDAAERTYMSENKLQSKAYRAEALAEVELMSKAFKKLLPPEKRLILKRLSKEISFDTLGETIEINWKDPAGLVTK